MGVGRKCKLTPEVQDAIVKALNVGATKEMACGYAGISEHTFYDWLRKAETGREPFAQFAQVVKKAEHHAVVGWLAFIETAARAGNWQAAAWKLERRYPKVFARQALDAEHVKPPDIHVHVHQARERLTTRLSHLATRHLEDAANDH